jgi:tRNA threonylcarbamoyladenosine dehydratase
MTHPAVDVPADFERRFGGLRRLLGHAAAQAVFDSHVVVIGVGGVGSWAAEAMARSGVGRLTLIDLDHVSESNINRQSQALGSTLGQAKVQALAQRLLDINPQCQFTLIEDFLTPDNLTQLLHPDVVGNPGSFAVLDACDQVKTKVAVAAWALSNKVPFVSVGAAGGKRQAHAVDVAPLSDVTHDPLLAQVRYRLRKYHGAPRSQPIPVTCVFSREPVSAPTPRACDASVGDREGYDSNLNCHGYGSMVTVTATFGMVAAGHLLTRLAHAKSAMCSQDQKK